MKKTVTLIIYFLFAGLVYSQNGWQIVYGGSDTYSPYYNSICFPNEMTGYIMGNRFYKKTTDGGNTWTRTDSVGSSNYYFLNSQTGWVFGNSGLYYTSNGGSLWSNVNTSIYVFSMFFLNNTTGYSCGASGVIYKTTNGGQNWIQLNSGVTERLNSIHFMNHDYGVCAGDWGTILTTTNGGNNWLKFTDVNMGFFTKISFIDQQTGYVCGTGDHIFRTTNSGLNWQSIYTGFTDMVVSFFFTGQNTGYMFGSYGSNLKTTNGGITWSLHHNTGALGKVFSVTSTISGIFWCTADTGAVHISLNEGANWQLKLKQFITYNDLNNVYFMNSFTGWICGNSGTLLRSTNGGSNWQFRNLSSAYNLKSLLFLNGTTGYICGGTGFELGVIYKTTNEGANWNAVYQDSFSLNSIYFLNNNTGWAVGAYGAILKTTNSGISWSVYKYLSTAWNSVYFIDENTGFMSRTSIFKSTNGGVNWNFNLLNVSTNTFHFINSNTGFFVNTGSNSVFYKTTNTGSNWLQTAIGSGATNSTFFISEQKGWLAGGYIKYTSNSGINWQIQFALSFPNTLNSVYFYNESLGWAVGSKGTILITGNGGIGITPITTEIPRQFYLHQNYPNPFNPVTKIRFNIPKAPLSFGEGLRVGLKIYDVLGKEIAVLVNENLKPGTYEVEWNASNFSSGVYFYSLITNEFTQTKKMVVLK